MKNSKNWKKWIYLDRKERNGIVIFTLILSAINIGGTFIEHQNQKEILVLNHLKSSPPSTLEKVHASVPHSTRHTENKWKHPDKKPHSGEKHKAISESQLHSGQKKSPDRTVIADDLILNPNTAGPKELKQLGLNNGQVSNLINYREKVGAFQAKEDLLKLYTINEDDYHRIIDHLVIPTEDSDVEVGDVSAIEPEKKDFYRPIDVNSATAADWEELKGIGPYYARKIIRYREKLGGFVTVDQIKETWDLPPELIDNNREFLDVQSPVQRIDLATTDYKMLIQHPYLNKKHTKLLLKLQGKKIAVDEEIMRDIFSEEEWKKAKHYLSW
ncbi:MAG TPA: helix-hairpin-helix domain-containing protein [Saprospiraceae bacterium]|nr:helix-hairpin-helix domain-containing protein [Saprospiraceae bacterium]